MVVTDNYVHLLCPSAPQAPARIVWRSEGDEMSERMNDYIIVFIDLVLPVWK